MNEQSSIDIGELKKKKKRPIKCKSFISKLDVAVCVVCNKYDQYINILHIDRTGHVYCTFLRMYLGESNS